VLLPRAVKKVRPLVHDGPAGRSSPIAVSRMVKGPDKSCGTPVTHDHAALAFYTGGETRVELQGEWNLRAGDVLIVPAGEPHRTLERGSLELWGLSFCAPCFASNGAAGLLEPFERVRDGASAVVAIPPDRRAHLELLFRELESAVATPRGSSEANEAVQRSLLTLILAEVDRAADTSNAKEGRKASGVVTDALRFIERNCLGPLTVDEVAAAVGRSSTYVTTALTATTGRSASQWIVSGRMAEARRLLLHGGEHVDVIAERVGYADSTHFIRMFRREHGETPAAWRTSHARTAPAARRPQRR
jgi:AraC family transcriptional activator of pobA